MRSESDSASSWSWVTMIAVTFVSCWMRRSSSRTWPRILRSSAERGSSSSSTRGRMTSARASAMRCCCPPESSAGLRWPKSLIRTSASTSLDALADLGLGRLAHAQAEADVLGHVHVREQGVVLEHDPDVALLGRHAGHVLPRHEHPAAVLGREAGDEAQDRRLARTRRSEERVELALRDLEADVVQHARLAVALRTARRAPGPGSALIAGPPRRAVDAEAVDQQRDGHGGDHDEGGQRVEVGLVAHPDERVDLQRQRLHAEGRQEVLDEEVVERDHEGDQAAARDGRPRQRQTHAQVGGHRRGAQRARGLSRLGSMPRSGTTRNVT